MNLLNRHIYNEFFQVLQVGTFSILGIFFGTVEFKNMITLLSQFDVPVPTIISIWLLQIPTGALYALPAGMLVSTMFILMRKHRDSEIVALQTLGVSRWRMLQPFFLIGIACSIGSFIVGESVAPQARQLSTKLLLVEACKTSRPLPQLSKIELQDADNRVRQIMFLNNTVGRTVEGFLLLDLTPSGPIRVTWSRFAERVRGNWQLREGQLFEVFSREGIADKGRFGSLNIPAASQLWHMLDQEPSSPLEKTTSQLSHQIARYENAHKAVPGELQVQFQRRYSQPLSCLLLVFAAIPIMFMGSRRDLRLPLAYGAVIVPSYFLLQQICLSLGESGALNVVLAAWLPACLLCLVALTFIFLLRQ